MRYRTRCPKCKGRLFLHSFVGACSDVPIYAGGYDLQSGTVQVIHPMTVCGKCGYLDELVPEADQPSSDSAVFIATVSIPGRNAQLDVWFDRTSRNHYAVERKVPCQKPKKT